MYKHIVKYLNQNRIKQQNRQYNRTKYIQVALNEEIKRKTKLYLQGRYTLYAYTYTQYVQYVQYQCNLQK